MKKIFIGLMALTSISAFAEGSMERCMRLPSMGTKAATVYNPKSDGTPALGEWAGNKTIVGLNDEVRTSLENIPRASKVNIYGVEDDRVVFATQITIIGSCK